MIKRKKTRKVKINDLEIGGDAQIVVESMTNTDPHNLTETINQILELENAGCQLVRIALPDLLSTELIPEIKKAVHIPIMGDVHFDYRIAIGAINKGIDALRLNPGNIRNQKKVTEIVNLVKKKNIVVRIGVNSGSINRKKYPEPTPEAMVESAFEHIKIFEQANYYNLIVSLKATDVITTIKSYEKFSKMRDYPLHIGITEAGTLFSGTIKSAVGVGILLYQGIGDTIRISLSGNPTNEIIVANKILQSLGIKKQGVEIIACPTCGRAEFDVEQVALELEKRLQNFKKYLKIAVMGCVVNGPGEAKDADFGIAGSKKEAVIFQKGKILKKVSPKNVVNELINILITFQ